MANNKINNATLESINGSLNYCILVGKNPIYAYKDGKKVSDNPTGTKLEVVLPGNRFTPLSVKIEGNVNVLPDITDEQINDSCASLALMPIQLVDCRVSLYSIGGQLIFSATACDAKIIPTK